VFGAHLPELLIVLVLALVVFGPKRLPEIGGALGKSIREFRDGTSDLKDKAMGRHVGKHKLAKMFGLGLRVLQMSPTAIFDRPDLCLSHGSRSHVIVSGHPRASGRRWNRGWRGLRGGSTASCSWK